MSRRRNRLQALGDGLRVAGKLALLRRSEWWQDGKIREWQRRRLAATLEHAVQRIPYYRDLRLDGIGEGVDAGLAKFPLLTKGIVQAEGARLRDPSLDPETLYTSTTSGSSGQPTTTWFDHDAWLLCKYALKIRRTLLGGQPFGERIMIFGEPAPGRHPAPTISNKWLYRELRLSVFLSLDEQYAALADFAPTMIYGAPSALKALCDYATERDWPLPPVRTAFLSSELISARVQGQLERDFCCRVIGVYGSTEFKEVAWQCPAGRYHLNFESVFVENLPPEEPDGEPRIALTTLVNRAMPLIRFDIGDYGRIGTSPCSCGRESPWLAYIAGRRVEYLELGDGRHISPYLLTTHVETVPGLRQYQIARLADGTLELRVVIFQGHNGKSVVDALHRLLSWLAGPETRVRVTQVEAIRRTAAGKHQIVTQEA